MVLRDVTMCFELFVLLAHAVSVLCNGGAGVYFFNEDGYVVQPSEVLSKPASKNDEFLASLTRQIAERMAEPTPAGGTTMASIGTTGYGGGVQQPRFGQRPGTPLQSYGMPSGQSYGTPSVQSYGTPSVQSYGTPSAASQEDPFASALGGLISSAATVPAGTTQAYGRSTGASGGYGSSYMGSGYRGSMGVSSTPRATSARSRPTKMKSPSYIPRQQTNIPDNPSHLFVPASHVSPLYRNPGDDNPDKWVIPNKNLEQLPHSVMIPLDGAAGKLTAEITIGTGYPEQKFRVEFDTGSTALWLVTPEACARQTCPQSLKMFNRENSQTYKPDGYTLKTQYATGEIIGVFAEDTVTIGEGNNKLVIKNSKIGEARSFTDIFDRFDIICGLSLVSPPMMQQEPASLLYTMTKQYGTTIPFGFYVNKFNPEKSKMIFGEGYQQFIVGELNTHKVHPVPFRNIGKFIDGWYVKFDGWMVEAPGAEPIELPVNTEMFALVDSGGSTFTGPASMIRELNQNIFKYANFPVSSAFTIDCNMDTNQVYEVLPDISLFVDGIKYTLAPHEYIGNQVGECRALFLGRPDDDKVVIGRPFFYKFFTRFDHSKKVVQFAEAKQDADNPQVMYRAHLEQRRWG